MWNITHKWKLSLGEYIACEIYLSIYLLSITKTYAEGTALENLGHSKMKQSWVQGKN
jgi:hypothetical protein